MKWGWRYQTIFSGSIRNKNRLFKVSGTLLQNLKNVTRALEQSTDTKFIYFISTFLLHFKYFVRTHFPKHSSFVGHGQTAFCHNRYIHFKFATFVTLAPGLHLHFFAFKNSNFSDLAARWTVGTAGRDFRGLRDLRDFRIRMFSMFSMLLIFRTKTNKQTKKDSVPKIVPFLMSLASY